jgi:predicted GNAT superfamily acetyltransferase
VEAWEGAERAARAAGVTLRPLATLADAEQLLHVMGATWGDQALLPREMVIALSDSGNAPYGAFDGERMIGYVLGWAGVTAEDGLHAHSHMLAALPDRRHAGVGYALKLAQRAQCLDRGIGLVRWTFDPLVARNAWFNLVKLGASADRFLPDFYGEMADSVNAGDRSDRLLVRWQLDREPMGPRPPAGQVVLGPEGDTGRPVPGAVRPPVGHPALVRIPREYQRLRADDPALGDAWRAATHEAFRVCFDAGLIVTGFTEDSAYVLEEADG